VKAQGANTYDLTVRGPNGFLRGYKGSVSGDQKARLDVRDIYAAKSQVLKLDLHNQANRKAVVRALDRYSGQSQSIELAADQRGMLQWDLVPTFGWYDLVLSVDGDAGFEVQLAGHIENGLPSSSDPALGSLRRKV
jgi:phospholipase C